MKGKIFEESPEYRAPNGKLTFKKVSEKLYQWESTNDWIDVSVRFCDFPKDNVRLLDDRFQATKEMAQKWEIQIGMVFFSRDKHIYFNELDTALLAVEKILARMIRDIQGDTQ